MTRGQRRRTRSGFPQDVSSPLPGRRHDVGTTGYDLRQARWRRGGRRHGRNWRRGRRRGRHRDRSSGGRRRGFRDDRGLRRLELELSVERPCVSGASRLGERCSRARFTPSRYAGARRRVHERRCRRGRRRRRCRLAVQASHQGAQEQAGGIGWCGRRFVAGRAGCAEQRHRQNAYAQQRSNP